MSLMFEKLRPMFFSILYFQYNGGQGGFFSFFFSPSNQHPNVLLSVLWWVLSFSFHFFSLDQRPNRKANRRKKTQNQNSNRTSLIIVYYLPKIVCFCVKLFFRFLLSLSGISYQWHKQNDLKSAPIFIRPETQAHSFISSGGQLYFSELAPSDDSTYYCSVVLTSLGGTGTYIGSSRAEVRTSLGFRLHVSSGGKGRHGAHPTVPRFETLHWKKCSVFCCCCQCFFSLFVIFDL